MRRAFFDTGDANADHEALTHRYVIHHAGGYSLVLRSGGRRGLAARVEVTDLRLLMFANGVGILTIGVEARELSYAQALWINEMMRRSILRAATKSRRDAFRTGSPGA